MKGGGRKEKVFDAILAEDFTVEWKITGKIKHIEVVLIKKQK